MRKIILIVLLTAPLLTWAQTSESTGKADVKHVFQDSLGNEMTRDEIEAYLMDNEDAGVRITRGENNELIMSLKSKKEVRERRAKANLDPETFKKTIKAASENKLIGKKLPDYTMTDIMGNTHTAASLKGKIVVMNFWFIGCKPCIKEIPQLNDVVEFFYDKPVVFLAPTFDEQDAVNEFLEDKTFNYQIISGMTDKEMDKYYDVKLWPTHIIYNKEGKIDSYLVGGQPNIKEVIKSLILNALTNK